MYCPTCGNGDKENLELPEAFSNKIIICHSEICQDSYYCRACKCKINKDDDDILNHLKCEPGQSKMKPLNLGNYYLLSNIIL